MDASAAGLSLLLSRVATHRAVAVRLTAEIAAREKTMQALLQQRVDGTLIDAAEDEILALRGRLMANDAAMMALLAKARHLNDGRGRSDQVDMSMQIASSYAGDARAGASPDPSPGRATAHAIREGQRTGPGLTGVGRP